MNEKWYHISFETLMQEPQTVMGTVSESKRKEDFWLSEEMLVIVSSKNILKINLSTKKFLLINPQLKVYSMFSLPLNLIEMVSGISQLKLKYGERYTGEVIETEEMKKIDEWNCSKNLIVAKDSQQTSVEQWTTTEVPFDLTLFNQFMKNIRKFKFPQYDTIFHDNLSKKKGFPIQENISFSVRGKKVTLEKKVVAIEEATPPKEILSIPTGYALKEKITFNELKSGILTEKKELSTSDKEIITFLQHYQSWYTNRDISRLDNWLRETFTEDTYIIGTNAIFPGEHEWRKGIHVAKEVYTNDFHNNWDLRLFIDEADIEVDGEFAWVAVFGMVTRETIDHPTRNAEVSRKRSLSRIKSMTEKDWDSKRTLFEIIHDASMILVQYERGDKYLWPVRCSYCLKKVDGKWKIKQLHYSWSGQGFPSARFYDEKEI